MSLTIIPPQVWLDPNSLRKPTSSHVLLQLDIPQILSRKAERAPFQKVIFVEIEPNAILDKEAFLLEHGNEFDAILTFTDSVLKAFPHALKYQPGEVFIDEKDWKTIDCSRKQFAFATVVGHKTQTIGQRFRQMIYFNQTSLGPTPRTIFRSDTVQDSFPELTNNPILGKERFKMFETFQFHLCIENSRQVHYFSEKLNDTLITKTIPIYYGCPNISDYYDTSGWIILQTPTLDELKAKLSVLTPTYYSQYTKQIEDNYQRVKKYSRIFAHWNTALSTIPWYS